MWSYLESVVNTEGVLGPKDSTGELCRQLVDEGGGAREAEQLGRVLLLSAGGGRRGATTDKNKIINYVV